jgi:hypothetical protein
MLSPLNKSITDKTKKDIIDMKNKLNIKKIQEEKLQEQRRLVELSMIETMLPEAYNYLRFSISFENYKKYPIATLGSANDNTPLFNENIDNSLKSAKKFIINDKQK